MCLLISIIAHFSNYLNGVFALGFAGRKLPQIFSFRWDFSFGLTKEKPRVNKKDGEREGGASGDVPDGSSETPSLRRHILATGGKGPLGERAREGLPFASTCCQIVAVVRLALWGPTMRVHAIAVLSPHSSPPPKSTR